MSISVTPQGSIYLCKTPLENDYRNQLTFTNRNAQSTYFNGTVFKSYSNYTYIKKDGVIKVNENIDAIRQCNYLFYVNTGFDSRTYYCFITGMEYINENCTAISFETDCFQSWYFDLEYKTSFVEREHVSVDTIGAHTIPEGLQTGEFIINGKQELAPDTSVVTSVYPHNNPFPNTDPSTVKTISNDFVYVVQLTDLKPKDMTDTRLEELYSNEKVKTIYNGVYSGLYYVGFTNPKVGQEIIKLYDQASAADAIAAIFVAPKRYFNLGSYRAWSGEKYIYAPYSPDSIEHSNLLTQTSVTMNNTIDGYAPRNNKLFTHEFNYLYVSNNSGTDVTFAYEDFDSHTPKFVINGALTQGGESKLIPVGYKYMSGQNYNYGVASPKYPTCAWASDYYVNWQTQNGVNMVVNPLQSAMGAGTGQLVGAIGTAALGSMVGGAVLISSGAALLNGVMDNIKKDYQASLVPDQAKGNQSLGDLAFVMNKHFTCLKMSVRAEFARSIDNFFDMFGYKVNRLKTPSITGRLNWNYVKTVGCNIEGNIPQDDLNIIRRMFDNGCTFWHNPANMYNYSLSNAIV